MRLMSLTRLRPRLVTPGISKQEIVNIDQVILSSIFNIHLIKYLLKLCEHTWYHSSINSFSSQFRRPQLHLVIIRTQAHSPHDGPR